MVSYGYLQCVSWWGVKLKFKFTRSRSRQIYFFSLVWVRTFYLIPKLFLISILCFPLFLFTLFCKTVVQKKRCIKLKTLFFVSFDVLLFLTFHRRRRRRRRRSRRQTIVLVESKWLPATTTKTQEVKSTKMGTRFASFFLLAFNSYGASKRN